MDFIIALILFIVAIIATLALKLSLIIGFLVGLVAFTLVGVRRGYSIRELWKMSRNILKSAMVVVSLLVLIGCITGLWRACGTIPYFICLGIRLIQPNYFIMLAFLLPVILSYAMGTSLGVTGTLGVILMALARSGGVNEALTAGAIMSGVYFGDRGSPSSSCANLVAAITGTDFFENLRLMLKTIVIPMVLSLGIFTWFSFQNPITNVDNTLLAMFQEHYNISILTILPAVLIVILPLLKVNVRWAMGICIGVSAVLAVALQHMSVTEILVCCVMGYTPAAPELQSILGGGGIISMLTFCVIVVIGSIYAGIFNGTGLLDGVKAKSGSLAKKAGRFPGMALSSLPIIGIFSSQAGSIIMVNSIWESIYDDPKELAQDIANSVVVLVGIVPWSSPYLGMAAMLGVGVEAVPYCILLFAIPICYAVTKRLFFKRKSARA